MRSSLRLAVVTAAAGLLTAGLAVSAAAAAPSTPYRLGGDGTTRAVYSYADAVRETVWVDIGLDQDHDGVNDRVAADIIRPNEPAAKNQKIPAIMDVSGYYYNVGRGNESQTKKLDANGKPISFPLFLDNFFVPRGYAVVLVDLAGTGRSTGCTDFAGLSEVASSTRVVDWLNGRVKGYSSPTGGVVRTAKWASGSAGQIGKSWDGQNVYESAASGVKGLKAAVPEAGIASPYTSYYNDTGSSIYLPSTGDYTSYFGLENDAAKNNPYCQKLLQDVRDSQPANGNYTKGWATRNFVPKAKNVKAAMLVVQGQDDDNVQPLNFGAFYAGLPKALPKKVWLSSTGHVDPFDYRRDVWIDTLHRWFDRFLYGIDNGIEDEPALSVERAPDRWSDYDTFPAGGTQDRLVYAAPTEDTAHGALRERPGVDESTPISRTAPADLQTGALTDDLRLSGTPAITVDVTAQAAGNSTVQVQLVDYGAATTRGGPGNDVGIENPKTTRTCVGGYTAADTGCFYDTPASVVKVTQQVIAEGQADLQHAVSIRSVNTVVAGKRYTVTIPLWTMDRIVPAGHSLGVIVRSTKGAELNYAPTSLRLPVVGGQLPLPAPTDAAPIKAKVAAPTTELSPLFYK